MTFNTKKNGYSLIEVLVAVALLMFAIVGPMTIAVKSTQSAQYARQQNTAFFLAQEGISVVNTIRNNAALAKTLGSATDAWAWASNPALAPCFQNYGCDIDFINTTLFNNVKSCSNINNCTLLFNESAGRAVYQTVSGSASPYRRVITFQTATPDEIIVTSRVEWDTKLLGGVQTVSLSTSLFNIFK